MANFFMQLKISNFNQALLSRYNIAFPKIKKRESLIGNSQKLKNKIVIITGASSGIGKACALEFSMQGASVVLAARRKEELNDDQ